MSDVYISQIQAFGFNFAPRYWALCAGQTLPIAQNSALFSLLGTNYGGNGTTTFALPNLQSRVPMHTGTNLGVNYPLGETDGVEQVMLTVSTLPAHNHAFVGTSQDANSTKAADGVALAKVHAPSGASNPFYSPNTKPQALNVESLAPVGGNLPHSNLQPYLAINWCICQYGVFPSRN